MRLAEPRRSGRLALIAAATLVALAQAPLPIAAADPADEVRALWVQRTSLTSPAAIEAMVRSARASGFNTLLVQVRGRGDAYFNGGLEPRAPGLASQPSSFDPLATTLAFARQAGLRVHAWVNVNLVSTAGELPPSREHLVYRHPEWLMVPRSLALELSDVDPRSPEYLGRLARLVRSQPSELEGFYTSPLQPAAADYTVGIVADLVARYPIDGVHLDYIRYPNDEFDYSREALAAFRTDVQAGLTEAERRTLDERAAIDPFAYPDAYAERWRQFRRSRLTALVMRLRTAVKARRPQALVSAAVFPDAADASSRRLQDWRAWAESGLVDVVCPMIYTPDAATFAAQAAAARLVAGARPMWAGIGAYRLSSAQTIERITTARRLGAGGIVLFSYDSLTNPPNGVDYLSQVGRAAFGQ